MGLSAAAEAWLGRHDALVLPLSRALLEEEAEAARGRSHPQGACKKGRGELGREYVRQSAKPDP